MSSGDPDTRAAQNAFRAARTPARWAWVLGFAVLVGLLGGFICGKLLDSRSVADDFFLDTASRLSARHQPAQHVAVVDISDHSIASLGQWPWPRYRIAGLVNAIAAADAAAIGLDILFDQPDRLSLHAIQQTYRRDFGITLGITGAPASLLDSDAILSSTMQRAGAVGASILDLSGGQDSSRIVRAQRFEVSGALDALQIEHGEHLIRNTPTIEDALAWSGFVNAVPDGDGLLRRIPALVRTADGQVHVGLALATFMRAQGVRTLHVERTPDGPEIVVAGRHIPVDAAGNVILHLRSLERYASIDAAEILQGRTPPAALKGRLVFIGTSASGLNDLHATAQGLQSPGPMLQAGFAQSIFDGDFIRVPVWSLPAQCAVSVLVCLMAGLAFLTQRSALRVVLVCAACALGVVAASALLFSTRLLFVSPLAPLLSLLTLFLVLCTTRLSLERQQADGWFERLDNARQVTMTSILTVAKIRDHDTGGHLVRTQHYVRAIARALREDARFTATLTPAFIEQLFASAPLHDVGKVGVPDSVLFKPGALNAEEYATIRQHTEIGMRLIRSVARGIKGDNFLAMAEEIALYHHERWDGKGYPRQLAGQAIPLSARIMAVADVYDALVSDRCYKSKMSHPEALRAMRECRGTQFDPDVLDAFLAIETEIAALTLQHANPPPSAAIA